MTLTLSGVALGGTDDAPVLVLGPSLGTSATTLWGRAAATLAEHVRVIGWDLPGHGASAPAHAPFTIADLATGVLELVERVAPGSRFHYAGDSVGGAVGLQLLLDAPDRVTSATLLCTGAQIGTPEAWHERAATVRASGTGALLVGSAERWFGPGFMEREPDVAGRLLHALRDADADGYAATCEALATFDVTDRLAEINAPVLAVAGAHDVPTPPESLATIAEGVRDGRLVVLDDVAHLAPAESPAEVARLVLDHTGAVR